MQIHKAYKELKKSVSSVDEITDAELSNRPVPAEVWGPTFTVCRWAGIKLLRFFENILFSRTNSNGKYRVDL